MQSLCGWNQKQRGPFVYRLGRKIFILERGVRFSYGLLTNNKKKSITIMANHKSSIKRIRQTASRRLHNRYYAKTARNAVRRVRKMTNKAEAEAAFVKLTAMLDKLAAKKAISKNKASNLKSKIARHINGLAA